MKCRVPWNRLALFSYGFISRFSTSIEWLTSLGSWLYRSCLYCFHFVYNCRQSDCLWCSFRNYQIPDIRSDRLAELKRFLALLSPDTPVHFEMASYVNHQFASEMLRKIMPYVDSIGKSYARFTTHTHTPIPPMTGDRHTPSVFFFPFGFHFHVSLSILYKSDNSRNHSANFV